MKTIENKKITYVTKEVNRALMTLEDFTHESCYFDLIYGACNRPSTAQSGFTYEEIKSIDRVKNALKPDSDSAEIEDADFEFAKNRISTNHWTSSSVSIADFIDYIKDLK